MNKRKRKTGFYIYIYVYLHSSTYMHEHRKIPTKVHLSFWVIQCYGQNLGVGSPYPLNEIQNIIIYYENDNFDVDSKFVFASKSWL
jgi:hypothetical protein